MNTSKLIWQHCTHSHSLTHTHSLSDTHTHTTCTINGVSTVVGLRNEISWRYDRLRFIQLSPAPSSLSVTTIIRCVWTSWRIIIGCNNRKRIMTNKKERLIIVTLSLFLSRKKKQATCFFYTSAHFPCKFKCTVLISKFTRFCRYSELLFSIIKKELNGVTLSALLCLHSLSNV